MATDLLNSSVDASPMPTTRAVAELWREVLQTDELPAEDDDFFALGGDSMTMVLLEFRIKEEFSVNFPAGVVLDAPTLRGLVELIDATSGSRTIQSAQSNAG